MELVKQISIYSLQGDHISPRDISANYGASLIPLNVTSIKMYAFKTLIQMELHFMDVVVNVCMWVASDCGMITTYALR